MPINAIRSVQALLTEQERPLSLQSLDALRARPDPYQALLCQPGGTLECSADRIGNLDSNAESHAYRALLRKATDSHADLVLTPEYSVPWLVFDDIIQGRLLPPKGALWALGFESITPTELRALKAPVASAAQPTMLLHETFNHREEKQKAFIDPLVYLFWARDDDTERDVLCALVQFKTVGSRDPDHVERDHLYLGTTIYKFASDTNPIALLGLICSDAFEFDAHVKDHHDALLLLHIQLNQTPGHNAYSAYRHRLFEIASNSRVELVCLNWAAGVMSDNKRWNDIAGSVWYLPPPTGLPHDNEIDALHEHGVYYSLVDERWHGFYLNYAPHALLLRKNSVFVQGSQVLAQHTAPQVIERLDWDPASQSWRPELANDGFTAFVHDYPPLDASLPSLCGTSSLAVERALELLAGPLGQFTNWYAVSELESLKVGNQESLKCVTVSQEGNPAREGVAFRRGRAKLAQAAITLPDAELEWLPSVSDLSEGFEFSWNSTRPHHNVVATKGAGLPATLLYLGENPGITTIKNMHAKLANALMRHEVDVRLEQGDADLSRVSEAVDRLCIVYRQNHTLRIFRPADYADIAKAGDTLPTDLTRGARD